jgi:hypothetical protein
MSLKNDTDVEIRLRDAPVPGGSMLIAGTFVRCAKCSREFRSTMTFKTLHEFERAATVGFIAQCPNCFTIFDCNRSNMYCELASDREPPAAGDVVPMPTRRQPASESEPESG